MAKQTDDTIKLRLSAEETVINDTVKIVANISGMVTRDRTEPQLREAIRAMLNRFIKAQWQFAGVSRTVHESGFEQISLIASARVPESENRALDKRRLEASTEGLTISRVVPDISFPPSLIKSTEQKLRLAIIAEAIAEARTLGEALGRAYRIKRINYFDGIDEANYSNSNRMSSMSAGATMKTSYGSGFSGGTDDAIGNAQKLTLAATITLACDDRDGTEL
jgi:hypothetical protein